MTKTIIYSCIFFDETFIMIYSLLLKSYTLFGNSNDNIDYLIICNPELKDKIQDIFDSLHINGKIWCVKLKSIFEVGYSKLQIFNYPYINSYHKILYLNYNVLITNSIHNILDLPLDNKLYAPQEGNTNHDLWGKQFFNNNPNCSAFTSDILLFNNNTIINKLFSQIVLHINSHIKNKSSMSYLLDQPFIVYHAIKENIYDNQKLTNIVMNNPNNFNNETICHFTGGPNDYKNIIIKMDYFMKNIMFKKKNKYFDINKINLYSENRVSKPILNTKIPKNIIQTGLHKIPDDNLKMIKYFFPEWSYTFFTDNDIIKFFNSNRIDEFPEIVNKFHSLKTGQHKADLFRYYYLYLKGGFYFDTDAMIYEDVNKIIENYDLITVNSSVHPNTIFQGILACIPKNEIIKKALQNIYSTNNPPYYHYFCGKLYEYIRTNTKYNIKLLSEERMLYSNDFGDIIKDKEKIVFKHYWCKKLLPSSLQINRLTNKIFIWENSTIIFLENGHMDAFGLGEYYFIDKHLVKCDFGNREHLLKFNKDYSQFISVRKDDFEVVIGNYL